MKKFLTIALALCAVPALAKNPNFSLKNKTGRFVWVRVQPQDFTQKDRATAPHYKLNDITDDKSTPRGQGSYVLGQPVTINENRSFALELEDSKEGRSYVLDIVYKTDSAKMRTLHASFDLKDGSTFYVKAYRKQNGDFDLAPQEGRFFKTTEGYSLSKNIQKKNLNPNIYPDATFSGQDAEEIE
jgi:hypothetical protein